MRRLEVIDLEVGQLFFFSFSLKAEEDDFGQGYGSQRRTKHEYHEDLQDSWNL